MHRHLYLISLIAVLFSARSGFGQSKVTIYPSFETAGVHLEFQSNPTSVTLQYRETGGAFIQAHPPVRYDARHSATSLFDLKPGTAYEVQVSGKTYPFTTRKQFALPTPTKVVNINAGDAAGLRAALSAATAGTEIRIPKGTYSGGFTVTKSGTAAQPIVISGVLSTADAAKPIENRTDLPLLTNSGGVGVSLSAAHVVLQHVRVADSGSIGVELDACRYCVVQYCQVYDNDDYSDTSWRFNIYVRNGGNNDEATTAGYSLIQYNHIADTDNVAFDAGEPWNGTAGVTYFGIKNNQEPGPGLVIRGNRIERLYDCICPCPDEGDDPGENNTDALGARNNSSHDVEVYDNYLYFCRDDGIESDGFCVNARIYRNTIIKTTNGISIAPALPGPYFWLRNRVRDINEGAIKINTGVSGTIRGHYFYHNTFSKESSNGYLMAFGGGSAPSKELYYKNNIFYSGTGLIDDWGGEIPEPEMDGDLWYSTSSTQMSYAGNSYGSFSSFQSGAGQEAHGVWADPMLDSTSLDLKSGSPAIDKAVAIPGINHIYAGNGPDIGAHEVGKPQPQPDSGVVIPGDSGPTPSPDGGVPGVDGSGPPNLTGDILDGGCGVAPSSGMLRSLWAAALLLLLVACRRTRS